MSEQHGVAVVDSAYPSASEQLARRLRLLAWTGLPLLGGVYYLILVSRIPPLTRLGLLEIVYCTPIVLSVVWGYTACVRSQGSERRFWGFLSTANLTLFSCEVLLVYWVINIDPSGPPRVSWPFHALHAVAAVSLIGSLLALSRFSQVRGVTRVRWGLDMGLAGLVAAILLLELYVRPVMGEAAPPAHILLGLGYAVFAMFMVGGTLGNVVGFKVDLWRSWDRMFAVALVIYAVGTMLWPAWYQTAVDTSRNYERGVLDLVQFAGHWLLMAAAVYRLTETKAWELRPLPPVDTLRWRWASAVTPTIGFIGVPAAALAAFGEHGQRAWFGVYVAFLAAVTAVALGRSVLVSLENGVLSHQSTADPLTGLANHMAFRDRLHEEYLRAKRYDSPLAVVLIDVDKFADVNAQLGHQAADQLLQEIGSVLRVRCPKECTLARLSGDDFAIIAPEEDALAASIRARRVLDSISIEVGGVPGSITASAGVAAYPVDGDDVDTLLGAARDALRRAKYAGSDSLGVTNPS